MLLTNFSGSILTETVSGACEFLVCSE